MGEFTTEAEEVIEREVKPTGNGAHVYVPKDWAGRDVRAVLVPKDVATEDCDICGLERQEVEEWVWIDDGGGAFFNICGDCQSQISGQEREDICPLCGTSDPELSKSSGFEKIGSAGDHYYGCDKCRKLVVFGDTEQLTPIWLK
jgi:putative transposon-encoded protein